MAPSYYRIRRAHGAGSHHYNVAGPSRGMSRQRLGHSCPLSESSADDISALLQKSAVFRQRSMASVRRSTEDDEPPCFELAEFFNVLTFADVVVDLEP